MLVSVTSEIRLAVRHFAKARLIWITCIVVLALGLGGTTAAFSALYAVVLRPLPYPDPSALVVVHSQFPRLQMTRLGVSPPDYRDLTQQSRLFSHAGVFFYLDLSRTGVPHAQKVNAIAATTSLFETLRVKPVIGRYFTAAEQQPGGPHAVLLSNSYWRAAFGRDPHILGKTMQLNGESYSIVGVMPASFRFPNEVTQMWVPVVFKPQQLAGAARQSIYLNMYARLAPGIKLAEASKRLDRISRDAAVTNRGDYTIDTTGWKYFIVLLSTDDNITRRLWTWVFFTSAMVLFVIVCVNVGSLLLLRSAERAFETSVRLALGARWLHIARQSLIEVFAICTVGGCSGLLIALAAIRLLNRSGQFGDLHLVAPVFAFGAAMTILTTAFCAVYPIWAVTRSNPADALNTGGHQRTGARANQYWRRFLVAVQVAASTVLLALGGLLLHSYTQLLRVPLGFDADRVMTMQISLPPLRYPSAPSQRIFYESVLDRLARTPGVTDASACTLLPFGSGENVEPFQIVGKPGTKALQVADWNNVLPRFFQTLRIPLLAGRYLDKRDAPGTEPVVIIDRNMARKYFPGENPLGQQIELSTGRRFSIIGVVASIKRDGLDVSDQSTLYFSAAQIPVTDMSVIVKTSAAMTRLPEIVQDIVTKVDSDQPVYNVASLQSLVYRSLSARRFVVSLLVSFAAIGTAITAIGLYGLLSYSVVLRRREFGIRAAVGATPGDLAWLVFTHGILLVSIGATAGGFVALPGARYLSSELYAVRVSDPITWLSIAAVLAVSGTLACLAPSWRASHANALSLLKQE